MHADLSQRDGAAGGVKLLGDLQVVVERAEELVRPLGVGHVPAAADEVAGATDAGDEIRDGVDLCARIEV